MYRYVKASITDLELSSSQIKEIESGLYDIVKKHFDDGIHSMTRSIHVSGPNTYDLLPYTAKPYSGYMGTSASPSMAKDSYKLNEFKKEVRAFLKPYGVTKIRYNTSTVKVHYGYISGPDDFPTTVLNEIYFG